MVGMEKKMDRDILMTNAPFTAAPELLRNRIIVLNAPKHNSRRVLREK